MKSNVLVLLLGLSTLLFSCQKEQTQEAIPVNSNDDNGSIFHRDTIPESCEPFPFGLLGLNNGNFTINSSRNLIAEVGYSNHTTSSTNQKIDNFTGTSYVHSQVTSFIYTAATYQPSNGIVQNNAAADAKLDAANANAIAVSSNYAGLTPNFVFGAVTSNKTINSIGHNTVVQMSSLDYNSKILTLNGTAGADDGFIINVTGNFDFSQSEILLNNVRPQRVIFNFPNPSNVTINKASNIFKGTILAPTGNVIYHNPASFEGSIIALNIAVHSDFNLTQRTYCNGN